MNISININPMCDANKSGIGYYQTELVRNMAALDSDNVYSFSRFRAKDPSRAVSPPEWLTEKGGCHQNNLMTMAVYQLICGFLPLPYSWFFKGSADISMFFNFFLPPVAKGKKVVVVYDTVINDFPETVKGRNKLLLKLNIRRSIKQADLVVTISQFSKQQIMRYYGKSEDKIIVISCAADRNKFYPIDNFSVSDELKKRYGIPERYYLYLGTLEPRKNISRLIEAYHAALEKEPSLPMLVIAGGKGWLYDDIFNSVKKLNIEDKIVFTGYVRDEDVADLMRGARLFCFPSLYEGFGMPPLEAMACGTPVITSDCSSLPEVVGECGIKVDPYSVENIADALLRANNEDFYKEQRTAGLKQADCFSWEKSADKLLRRLELLTNDK